MVEAVKERRADRRVHTACPVKLRADRAGLRHLAGWSRDVSAGGAMIELTTNTPLHPGDRVAVGLAVSPRQALIRSSQMIEAVVVRCLRHDDYQHLAVRFTQRQRLARAG